MNTPARILVVDDNETNRDILVTRLEKNGYQTLQAADGEEALASVKQNLPDLILLDVEMPKLDGFEVCRRLRKDASMAFIPIILCTARAASQDVVTGLDAGADEYLTKPIDQAAMVARVRSMLRIKELHDQVQAQAKDLAAWNETLEARVNEQVGELDRMNRLKGFLVAADRQARRIRSRSFWKATAATSRWCSATCAASPPSPSAPSRKTSSSVLQEYYRCLGECIDQFEGTLQHFAGDGLMIIFNDPIACAEPAARAVRMAVEMRTRDGGACGEMASPRP